nr:MAG TPA: hypothetical protein [Bacteriophage sp.]
MVTDSLEGRCFPTAPFHSIFKQRKKIRLKQMCFLCTNII